MTYYAFRGSSTALTSEPDNAPPGLSLNDLDHLVCHPMPLPMDNSTSVHLVIPTLACWWVFLVATLKMVRDLWLQQYVNVHGCLIYRTLWNYSYSWCMHSCKWHLCQEGGWQVWGKSHRVSIDITIYWVNTVIVVFRQLLWCYCSNPWPRCVQSTQRMPLIHLKDAEQYTLAVVL